jgi:hypothetical protein
VLEEMVESSENPGQWEKVIDKLLKTNNSPIWAIEHTRFSQGRFLFVTDRINADGTIDVIQNELVRLAHQTAAFHKHINDGEKFFGGIQKVEPRMTRRVRHEQSVRSRYSAVTAQESASARQGSRFRQVTVSNAPWSLEEFPLMVPATSSPAYKAPASYASALAGIPAPPALKHANAGQETVPSHISGPKGSTKLKTSITSELGDDASTLISLASTVAEQSQLIKNLMKKAEDQEAVEARINLAMTAKLAEQEANRELEAHLEKLKQDDKDEAHRSAQARSAQELLDSETRHRASTTALLLTHQAEMKNALAQMALRDELHLQELETARSQHTQDLNKMMQQVEENNTKNKTEVSGNLKDMTTSLMLHMSAMMEHHANVLPTQPHSHHANQHPGNIEVDAARTEASPITMTTRTDPNTQVETVTKEAAASLQGTLETQATSIPQGEVDEEAMETEGLELLTQEEPRMTPLPIEALATNPSESTLQTSDQMETLTRSQGGQDLSDDQVTMHQSAYMAHHWQGHTGGQAAAGSTGKDSGSKEKVSTTTSENGPNVLLQAKTLMEINPSTDEVKTMECAAWLAKETWEIQDTEMEDEAMVATIRRATEQAARDNAKKNTPTKPTREHQPSPDQATGEIGKGKRERPVHQSPAEMELRKERD